MPERNVEKIKRLEHELGRYRKKVADDEKEIGRLRGLLAQADRGNRDTQAMVDAILTAVTLKCGEDARDPDDESKVLGKRLILPRFNFLDMRTKYEIHARKDEETDGYIIGVVERSSGQEEQGDGQA